MADRVLFKVSCISALNRWKNHYIGIKHFIFHYKLYNAIGEKYVSKTHFERIDLPIATIQQKMWNDRKVIDFL
jgi:hypothetical protein